MKKKKKKKRIRLKPRFYIILLTAVVALGAFLIWPDSDDKQDAAGEVPAISTAEVPGNSATSDRTNISIACVGDVMTHSTQVASQYDAETKTYNFDNNFTYVKPIIQKADLALCNVETTFAGQPYTGYPTFSSPDSLATALKKVGFDVALTSNNHMMDKGLDGVKRTLQVLHQNKLATAGSVLSEEENRFVIKKVKGIKVGVVAYTYETGAGLGETSINGQVISDEAAAHINSFNFNTLTEDLSKIKNTIKAARDAGAQVIIVYYHWGEEYHREVSDNQERLAKATAQAGADVIFASHPHVLQKTDKIRVAGSGKTVPVFYSMGNFLSNQRAETLNNRYTEEGVIAKVSLTYAKGKGVTKAKLGGVPTWVDRNTNSGKRAYTIVPLDDNYENNSALAASGSVSRARQALEDANEILGIN